MTKETQKRRILEEKAEAYDRIEFAFMRAGSRQFARDAHRIIQETMNIVHGLKSVAITTEDNNFLCRECEMPATELVYEIGDEKAPVPMCDQCAQAALTSGKFCTSESLTGLSDAQ